jgi:hypothetical protein
MFLGSYVCSFGSSVNTVDMSCQLERGMGIHLFDFDLPVI